MLPAENAVKHEEAQGAGRACLLVRASVPLLLPRHKGQCAFGVLCRRMAPLSIFCYIFCRARMSHTRSFCSGVYSQDAIKDVVRMWWLILISGNSVQLVISICDWFCCAERTVANPSVKLDRYTVTLRKKMTRTVTSSTTMPSSSCHRRMVHVRSAFAAAYGEELL